MSRFVLLRGGRKSAVRVRRNGSHEVVCLQVLVRSIIWLALSEISILGFPIPWMLDAHSPSTSSLPTALWSTSKRVVSLGPWYHTIGRDGLHYVCMVSCSFTPRTILFHVHVSSWPSPQVKECQVLLFSATVPSWVRSIANKYTANPLTVDAVGKNVSAPNGRARCYILLWPTPSSAQRRSRVTVPTITDATTLKTTLPVLGSVTGLLDLISRGRLVPHP